MLELFYFVYVLFIVSVMIIVVYWNSNLHKQPKFTVLLNLVSALTIFFTSFAIIVQLYTFTYQQIDAQIKLYENMFNDLFDSLTQYMETVPKMKYYYDDMFHPLYYKPNPNIKRSYSDEQQITILIIQKIATIVFFVESDQSLNTEEKENIKTKIRNITANLVGSPIFVENYLHIKDTLASPAINAYFQKEFNI